MFISGSRWMTIGDFLLRRLGEAGVGHLFGVPGDFNLELLQQLEDTGSLKWVGTCSELNASYAADGYAQTCTVPWPRPPTRQMFCSPCDLIPGASHRQAGRECRRACYGTQMGASEKVAAQGSCVPAGLYGSSSATPGTGPEAAAVVAGNEVGTKPAMIIPT